MKPTLYKCWCGFVGPFDKPNHDCYWQLLENGKKARDATKEGDGPRHGVSQHLGRIEH
jgi:hypothetical protein